MNPIVEKWLQMLESGDYEQTQFFLKQGGCYCALGLLCLAAGVDTKGDSFVEGDDILARTPSRVAAETQMVNDGMLRISMMNDTQDMTFEEIAAAVRKDPQRYFATRP